MMNDQLLNALITFAAAFLGSLAVGMDLKSEVMALRTWAHIVSDHLKIKHPARVGTKKDAQ